MSLKDEIEAYEKAKVSLDTGEIEFWDHVIFPNVIRKRQVRLIVDVLEQARPGTILDFGCGAGWLSKFLSSKGYDVIGIDVSSSLIRSAIKVSTRSSFIVGDCVNLPFGYGVFDCIIGSAILHHLDPHQALAECYRATAPGGTLLLMEPNRLNPPAAFGRKITNVQTKGESPFYPWTLRSALIRTGWAICDIRYLFPYSFSLSYLLRIFGLGDCRRFAKICPLIEASERIFEKVPYISLLSYLIFAIAKKG